MGEEKLRNARLYNNDKNPIHLPRQNPYFCLKCLKIKDSWDLESDLYPCCTSYFIRVPRKARFC